MVYYAISVPVISVLMESWISSSPTSATNTAAPIGLDQLRVRPVDFPFSPAHWWLILANMRPPCTDENRSLSNTNITIPWRWLLFLYTSQGLQMQNRPSFLLHLALLFIQINSFQLCGIITSDDACSPFGQRENVKKCKRKPIFSLCLMITIFCAEISSHRVNSSMVRMARCQRVDRSSILRWRN